MSGVSFKRLLAIYGACTVFAATTPFVLSYREGVRRRAIPVNSEPPLEQPPVLTRGVDPPACVSAIGIIYRHTRERSYWAVAHADLLRV